jgi:hypothetical protein
MSEQKPATPAAPSPTSRARPAAAWAIPVGLLLGTGTLFGLHFALLHTYWDYSEGVYALTAHLMLHGHGLYSQVVGAQPPGVFLTGAALLAIHDGLESLRLGVAALQLIGGLISAGVVWRLTGNRLAAALTAPLSLLTPWAVHEHGALIPELVGIPAMLGAVALASSDRYAPLAGVLCGLAPLVKLPFLIPAAAIVLTSAAPRRSGMWALTFLILGAGVTTLLGGSAAWRDAVYAQTSVGVRGLAGLKGYWAQAAWNLVGLVVAAAVSIRYRARALEPGLYRVATAFALAALVTLLGTFKQGTSLDILTLAEAGLIPLAVSGLAFVAQGVRERIRPARIFAVAGAAGLALVLGQSASLLLAPDDPRPFLRPGSHRAWAVVMSAAQTRSAVARARSCPPGVAYAGPPLIAYLADRKMPDNQPDQFIVPRSSALRGVAARVRSTRPVCR